MEEPPVELRPVRGDDLWLFERIAVDPDAGGRFNWSGYKDIAGLRARHERDGLIGPDGGRLIVMRGDDVAGFIAWSRATYGIPDWWCWNIGIGLLPEFRDLGVGTRAQYLMAEYLFNTTASQRVEAHTDVENLIEQRALERAGFRREGVVRSAQFRYGRWCDVVLYSLLREEFQTAAQPIDINEYPGSG